MLDKTLNIYLIHAIVLTYCARKVLRFMASFSELNSLNSLNTKQHPENEQKMLSTQSSVEQHYTPEILVARNGLSTIYLIGTLHVANEDFAASLKPLLEEIYPTIECIAAEKIRLVDIGVNPKDYGYSDGQICFKMDTLLYNDAIKKSANMQYGYSLDTEESYEKLIDEMLNPNPHGFFNYKTPGGIDRDALFAKRMTAAENLGKTQLVLMGEKHIPGVKQHLEAQGYIITSFDDRNFDFKCY